MARRLSSLGRAIGRSALGGLSLLLAAAVSWAVFMLLPFLEQATRPAKADLEVRAVGTADLPPPPPAPPEEKPPEAVEEETPEMADSAPPLDLSQLEVALNPAFGDGGGGDFALRLPGVEGGAAADAADEIFSAADLDQLPRAMSQTPPDYPPDLRRKKISGTVHVLFVVDRSGRVVQPSIEQAPHPQLGVAAVSAVRKWRFEPGRRQGQPVPFRMRVPITFLNQ